MADEGHARASQPQRWRRSLSELWESRQNRSSCAVHLSGADRERSGRTRAPGLAFGRGFDRQPAQMRDHRVTRQSRRCHCCQNGDLRPHATIVGGPGPGSPGHGPPLTAVRRAGRRHPKARADVERAFLGGGGVLPATPAGRDPQSARSAGVVARSSATRRRRNVLVSRRAGCVIRPGGISQSSLY